MQITLEDKYIKNQGKVFVTGSQVLVKLPLVQKTSNIIEFACPVAYLVLVIVPIAPFSNLTKELNPSFASKI